MARIVHSPTAEDDLLEIWVGLAAINVFAAERLLDDLARRHADFWQRNH